MRKALTVIGSAVLVACGSVFGGDDAETIPDPLPPPATPEENAAPPPPVGGDAPEGIFVTSSRGDDSGSGSTNNPLKTLAKAFTVAKERGLRVIACAETFEESVTVLDGVSAYGYYDCNATPWKRIERRAVVRSKTSPAAVARGITLPTRLEGFEIVAPDLDGAPATDDAGSSVALEVRDSQRLAISDSLLHGGKGAPGLDGKDGPLNPRTAMSNGAAALDQGNKSCNPALQNCGALRVLGVAGGTTTCAIGAAGGPGGQGGDGRWYNFGTESTGAFEYRGRPIVATAATAVGGLNDGASALGRGEPGTDGAHGSDGTDGVNGVWSLAGGGFVRGNGTAGQPGEPGQGGGGGGGTRANFTPAGGATSPPNNTYYATATGGGGGAGGCAGQPGIPATGGGASIGALVVKSGVTFERTRIETAQGGRAGLGNIGIAGSTGGTGGAGAVHTVSTTGKGGDGGGGGRGGASGHGAPGPSIALAYLGPKPPLTDVALAPGPAGAGQPELKQIVGGAVGTKLLPAVIGVSMAEYEIKF